MTTTHAALGCGLLRGLLPRARRQQERGEKFSQVPKPFQELVKEPIAFGWRRPARRGTHLLRESCRKSARPFPFTPWGNNDHARPCRTLRRCSPLKINSSGVHADNVAVFDGIFSCFFAKSWPCTKECPDSQFQGEMPSFCEKKSRSGVNRAHYIHPSIMSLNFDLSAPWNDIVPGRSFWCCWAAINPNPNPYPNPRYGYARRSTSRMLSARL